MHRVIPREYRGIAYHSVTTSFEYVFVGTDFALARPVTTDIQKKYGLKFLEQRSS